MKPRELTREIPGPWPASERPGPGKGGRLTKVNRIPSRLSSAPKATPIQQLARPAACSIAGCCRRRALTHRPPHHTRTVQPGEDAAGSQHRLSTGSERIVAPNVNGHSVSAGRGKPAKQEDAHDAHNE